MAQIIVKMSALKALGAGFSLDDFGTGHFSLSCLKRLNLAQSLGLGGNAEGLETGPQRDFLATHDCHACQGYFFIRPVPLPRFESLNLQRFPLPCLA